MASSSSFSSGYAQERQLILMETMNKRLDAILDGQRKLEERNTDLQQENAKLKSQVSQLERQTKQTKKRSRRSTCTQSTVEVPNDLRKRFRFIYKRMVAKGLTQGFIVDESPESDRNQALYDKIKGILKKEHGGENCQWTDLQMEAQLYRYFKTIKERDQRIKGGKNEEHKELCKRNRRISTKLERRCSGYDALKPSLSAKERMYYEEVLFVDYMSSEESDFEEQEDQITGERRRALVGYLTKKLPWERTLLSNIKAKLDRAHRSSLTPHARQMAKPRHVGGYSERPAPEGPSWAVRLPQNNTSE